MSDRGQHDRRGPQIITITGASGGVGCTSLAVNLGTTLAKSSPHEAILADFDLLFGSVDACLDIIPDQSLQGIIQNIDRLDLTLLKRSLTRHSSGLYVLPHPAAMEEAAKIDPESAAGALLVTLLKAALPLGPDRHQQGAPGVRLRRVRDGRRDPGGSPARPDLPAEHRAADAVVPAVRRAAIDQRQAGRQPARRVATTPRSA